MAPGMASSCGEHRKLLIYSGVDVGWLLFSACRESFDNCCIILPQGSGRLLRPVIGCGAVLPYLARCRLMVRQMKSLYSSVELLGRDNPYLKRNGNSSMINGVKQRLLMVV